MKKIKLHGLMLIFTVIFAVGCSFFCVNNRPSQVFYADSVIVANANSEDLNTIDYPEIDSQINNEELQEFIASTPEGQTRTIYNLAVMFRFSGESEHLHSNFYGTSYPYMTMLDNCYNKGDKSLNEYYKSLTNGKVNLVTKFLFADASLNSLQINKSRGYFCPQSTDNAIGYSNDSQESTREQELQGYWIDCVVNTINTGRKPTDANGLNPINFKDLDSDGDNYFDCLTILYAPQNASANLTVPWSSPLWAMKWGTWVKTIAVTESINGITYTTRSNTYNQLTPGRRNTVNTQMTEYFSYTGSDGKTYNSFATSTACHEMGHVLGLGDLYDYAEKYVPVSYWTLMSSHTKMFPQYMTTYERESMGWLYTQNIQEIKYKGQYTLNVVSDKKVNGSDLLAYKVQVAGNQFIYFEYRTKNDEPKNKYDYNNLPGTGLIIYRVYTGRGDKVSNSNNQPWGLEVLGRNVSATNNYLSAGQSFGTASPSIKDKTQAITYFTGTTESTIQYLNTGLSVTVDSIDYTNGTLTFTIDGENLLEPEQEIDISKLQIAEQEFLDNYGYSQSEYGNDINAIYNRLKLVIGKSKIKPSDFTSLSYLDLSSLNLKNLSFLKLLNLSNLQFINLYNNYLNLNLSGNQADWNSLLDNNENIKLGILIKNTTDLNTLSATFLNAKKILWGLQNQNVQTIYFNSSVSFKYNWNIPTIYTTYITMSINGSRVSSSLNNYNLSIMRGNSYTISYTCNLPGFTTNFINEVFTSVSISTPYNSGSYKNLWSNDDIYVNDKVMELFQITPRLDGLTASWSKPNLNHSGSVDVEFFYQGDVVEVLSVYVNILEYVPITVELVGGDVVLSYDNFAYTEQGIKIYRKGVELLDYVFNKTGNAKTYYYQIYEASKLATGKLINTGRIFNNLSDINPYNGNYYIIRYHVFDEQQNEFKTNLTDSRYLERIIEIKPGVVTINDVDRNLYIELQKLNAKINNVAVSSALYQDSFINETNFDLSSKELTSINGLKKFLFKNSVLFNLNDNKLNNIQEVKDLISANEHISNVALIFNNFTPSGVNSLTSSSRQKCIFGVQNVPSLKISSNLPQSIIVDYYNDYFPIFGINLLGNEQTSTISTDKITFNNFGSTTIEFSSTTAGINKVVKKVEYYSIQFKQNSKTITKEYSDVYELQDEWFNTNCPKFRDYLFYDDSSLSLDRIGTYNLNIKIIVNNDEQGSLTQTINVVDTTAPIITLNGDATIYICLEEVSNYQDQGATASDEYAGEITSRIQTNMSALKQQVGQYNIVYSVSDNYNTTTAYRKIIVGDIKLQNNNEEKDVNVPFTFPLRYSNFMESDIIITYSIDNGANFVSYKKAKGITIDKVTDRLEFIINVTHSKQPSLIKTFNYRVKIDDKSAPSVTILGGRDLYYYLSEDYVEYGIRISDNSLTSDCTLNDCPDNISVEIKYINKTTNQEITSMKDKTFGEYEVCYYVSDSKFTTVAKRRVNVLYNVIDEIVLDKTTYLTKYEAGQEVIIGTTLAKENAQLPIVEWFVNDAKVLQTHTPTFNYKFEEEGTYIVRARIINYDKQGRVTYANSESIEIEIYKSNIWSKTIFIVAFAIGILAVGGIVAFLIIKRKRNANFY